MRMIRVEKPPVPMRQRLSKALYRDRYMLLLFLPVFIYYVVFCYLPLPGLAMAFQKFNPGKGIFGSEWVGIDNFIQFFQSPFAPRLLRNTVLLSVYLLLFGFPVPVLFAVCVMEIGNMKLRRTLQTVSYLPHFISTVVLVGMMMNIFGADGGVVNQVIKALGGTSVNFFMDPGCFRSLYVGSGIWKSFGFSSILYISAITSIDPELYEAGKIDGITKFKEVYYITLPMLVPTLVILFIMELGQVMNVGFEKVFLMYNPGIYETSDVISTYVYRKGIESSDYSFSTAVGLFNSIINFILVYGSNMLSRRLTKTSLW